jgi:hypothetical protein
MSPQASGFAALLPPEGARAALGSGPASGA